MTSCSDAMIENVRRYPSGLWVIRELIVGAFLPGFTAISIARWSDSRSGNMP
jgi:hypothetical protein